MQEVDAMTRGRTRLVGALTALTLTAAMSTGASAAGHVETVVVFDPGMGQLPEGVAVADDGTIYASVSPLGQLVRVGADGTTEVVGTIEGLAEGDFGLIGITVGPDGAVYGGVFSGNPDVNGVWRFDPETGSAERLAGTEEVALANDVAFGADGTLYISDTMTGGVWRVVEGGSAEPWLVDPLLGGTGDAGFGFPIGANGIDVHDGTVYVGVSETAQLVTIPIGDDGSAGEATMAMQYPALIDGVAVGSDGTVYTTHPVDNLIARLVPGELEIVAEVGDGLDAPSSVESFTDADGTTTLYIANFSIAMGGPLGAGPSILAIDA